MAAGFFTLGAKGPPRVSASVGEADYGETSPKLREGGSS